MKIRLANYKDKQQVLSLLDEFSRELNASDVPSQIGGDIFDKVINRADILIFVAEENEKLIGLVTFYLLPNIRHGYHRGHVEDVFVTKSKRKKGVGTEIFNEIKNYCRRNKIKVIKLDSGIKLEHAHKFYQKNGGEHTEIMFRFEID